MHPPTVFNPLILQHFHVASKDPHPSVFGYLYLGARTGLPPAPDGAPEPATPVQLVGNIKAFPAGTPILVDWMSDTPDFTSHGDYAHVLMLDMSVQRVNFGDAKHRWTSEKGTKFFW